MKPVFLLLFAVFLCAVAGAPQANVNDEWISLETATESEEGIGQKFDHELPLPDENSESVGRFRRATCDLLSISTKWGSVNHAACAAHCIAMRKKYRGGYCSKGVCHCRR